MPRLSNSDYLYSRSELLALLNEKIPIQVHFSYSDQMVLHAYFVPTMQINDEEALAYRKVISKENPSLPNRAGKLMKRVAALRSIDWSRTPRSNGIGPSRRLVVQSLVRAEPDIEKIAGTLIALIDDAIKRDTEK